MRVVTLLFLLVSSATAWYYGRPDPGSSTQGGVWPLPWTLTYGNINHVVDPGSFSFTTQVKNCDVIDKAIVRYRKLMFAGYDANTYSDVKPTLTSVLISVTSGCNTNAPQLEMDESYQVNIDDSKTIATITANEVWGVLRALETFSQLVYLPSANKFRLRAAAIADSPRFPHRGVMIDSSRHFLPIGVILQNLDLMAQNKMNVLHWHLVDSEAFPYPSLKFPNLTACGAYTPAHTYSVADIKKVIDYARLRGIRVIAEFDTPGHTGSWGYCMPNLLPVCYNSKGAVSELSNIIDATWDPNYDFLSDFFTEALALFPDNYMHFGGDEVSYDMTECWYNNPQVRQRMTQMGFGSDTSKLLNYYWQRLLAIIDKARPGTKKVVWQEVLDLSVQATGSIAHVWKGDTIDEVMQEMATVTANGHKAILSSCWYLNYIKYGADWGYVNQPNMQQRGMYYECDPTAFQGTAAQKALVMGGEAAIWGEFVDGSNLIQRLWPRASAVAERLWSDPAQTTSADVAWPRLHEMRRVQQSLAALPAATCRLVRRGFPAQVINDPDYCPFEWNPPYQEL